jgi:O-antigen ligase
MSEARLLAAQDGRGVAMPCWPVAQARAGAVSSLAWAAGCFFSCRTIFVFISARWLNAGTLPGVIVTFVVSAILLAAAALQAFGPAAQPIGWVSRIASVRWAMLYLIFSGCSLLWTASVSPLGSALYWCSLAADVLIVLLAFRSTDARPVAHSIMKGFIWASCLLAAIAWILPAAEDLRLGDLDYFNTNQIANLCALSLFLCSFLAGRKDGAWRLATVFLAFTLFRSLSKSTLVAFVIAQLYRLLVDRGMSRKRRVLLVVGALLASLAFWGLLAAYYDIYTTTGNQAETLTGRTAIWAWSVGAALGKPWMGNGIDAMWKVAPPFGGELFQARHAENELLQQFFAYGLAGIIMLVGIYGSLWRRFRSIRNPSERSILISLLIFVLVRGVVEAEPFDLLLPLWLITTLVCLVVRAPAPESGPSSVPAPPAFAKRIHIDSMREPA